MDAMPEASAITLPKWAPTFLKHRRLLAILALVDVLIAGAVMLSGFDFLCLVLSVASIVYLGLPALILLIVFWRSQHRALMVVAGMLASFVVLLVLLVPANIGGYAIAKWEVRRTKRAGEIVAGQLDTWRGRTGQYPSSLDELGRSGTPVRMPRFTYALRYETDAEGKTFCLTFYDPIEWFGWSYYAYSSSDRKWTYVQD